MSIYLCIEEEKVQDYITTDSEDTARKIAKNLVDEELAACVQILPEKELLLFIKTRKELYDKVEKRIVELHNYKVPEIIALTVAYGLSAYLKWIDDNTI